ncbi:hypothetical protein U879_00320 [Defluviimonas sp. 20V17]|uniref:Anti-sigma-K factor RskA n=1 Tax=Allgaiera indica TaxID=765699 RepID=A0AAN4UTQ4_9RHOB|nr:anti-sigma factor [Allgaiera indica]KDB05670.1 hypothetical protein U879_00320 [Defluviimonas sp. 20V17]GHE04262.1 hypothetical protein GCM10008024_30810 [Allgaiera indica]SDX38898.1 Anti-sigma-K factor RskA [Allgaiera indica]
MSADPLADLIGRLAARDRAALRDLYDAAADRLFAAILHILRDRAEAEDALQETFARIWQRAKRFDPAREGAMAWLTAIARDCAAERRRTKPAAPGRAAKDPRPAADPLPAPDLLPGIEVRLFGNRAPGRRRYLLRAIFVLTAALALALAVVVFWQAGGQRPTAPRSAATLEQRGVKLAFSAEWSPATRELQVTRTLGPPAGPGHDYELWLIDRSGAPVSLGLLRGHLYRAAVPALPPGAELAVSLEPMGGSRTGQPTGPVLVKGVVARL